VSLFVLLASTGVASAQDVQGSEVERTALARALFREGVGLSEQGEWADAADRFRRSLALRDSPVVAFNLATACMHLGSLVEAVELFGRAARDGDAPEALREAAATQLEALRPRLGRLTLEVTGPSEGVTLELDGEPVPRVRLGIGAPADPGTHVLSAQRGGQEVARAEVQLAESGDATLRLEIPPPEPEPEPPPLEEVERDRMLEQPVEPPPSNDDVFIGIGVAAGAVVAAAIIILTTVLVLEGQGPAPPIEGNLGPPVIVFD